MEFRQLLPEAGSVAVAELLGSLDLTARAPAERPYTVANFVASADGRVTVEGRSGPLGDEGDSAIFHGLREHVDAVMAGTGTLAVERYGRILGKVERRERRLARGLAAEPLACIVTRSGMVPEIPMFAEPEARVVIFSPATVQLEAPAAQVCHVVLEPAEMTLTTVAARLRGEFGVGSLLCEGGPRLFGALLAERLVDELFLTVSPMLIGGGLGPALASGPELPEPARLQTLWALERGGSLFLRYGIGP